jgi:hypothetical protein
MKTTHLIIRVRKFANAEPYFSIQSVIADHAEAVDVTDKYNQIAQIDEQQKDVIYKCIPLTL